jgi:hypothetical protein
MTKLSILAAVLLCACAGMLPGAGQNPVITTATINSAANQITISGLNLAPATGTPAVGLGNAVLTVVSASATQIVGGQVRGGVRGAGSGGPTGTGWTARSARAARHVDAALL